MVKTPIFQSEENREYSGLIYSCSSLSADASFSGGLRALTYPKQPHQRQALPFFT